MLNFAEQKANRAALDIESDGLDPSAHMVLEIGVMIMTPDFLRVIAVNHWLTKFENPAAVDMRRDLADPYVRDMHDKDGLWEDLRKASLGHVITKPGAPDEHAFILPQLSEVVAAFIKQHAPAIPNPRHPDRPTKPVAFGNNVEVFDMRFLKIDMPEVFESLHYRTINASSLREFIEGAYGVKLDVPDDGRQHRVLSDIVYSLKAHQMCLDLLGGKLNNEIQALRFQG
jgi:oligoribonuclease (3'-5' exoribonuclease)